MTKVWGVKDKKRVILEHFDSPINIILIGFVQLPSI